MDKTIGIIAGNGRFPLMVAEEAAQRGFRVVVCGILREAEESLKEKSQAFLWVKMGELKKLVQFFKQEGVSQAVMAGKVEKVRLFQGNVSPDLEMLKVIMKTRDFKDDSLLGGIADYLEAEEIELLDSTTFLKNALPGEGVIGRKKPSKELMDNILFGFKMAKSIAGLDLGQTVVVKRKAVLAVEAIEGTDSAIHRGGLLGNGKVTVVKVSKPNQDMRFDVPAVGLKTMDALIEADAEVFAYEAGKTIFLDMEDFVYRANKHGIAVVGINGNL